MKDELIFVAMLQPFPFAIYFYFYFLPFVLGLRKRRE
jgi:hypothetical protein